MSAITANARRKMKKYAVLTREPRCFLGSFDFSWEQRKLSEMCGTFEYGLNAAAKEFDGKNKYIRITDIDDASREFLLSDLSSPDICLDGMSKYLLSSGDIVFARTGASVGKTYIYRENDGIVYFAGFLIRAKVNQDNDAEFVFQSTLSPSYEKYIRITSQRSGQPGVNAQEYSEYDLFAPSKEEQQRIGHFLRGIDNLITLHQRKCVFLFSFFRACISMNFTASTFSWEQRKFEEIAVRSSVICSDDTLPRVEYEDIVSGTGRLNKDIYAKQSSKSGIAFHQGDVLYGKLRPYLQNWLLPTFDGLAVGDFWVLQPQNADSSFLYRLIQSRQFDEVANQSTGTKMPRADWKLVSKTVFSIPSSISEQAAIGTYFTALDSLITLHQRQHFLHSTPDISLSVRLIHPFYTSSWEQRKVSELFRVTRGYVLAATQTETTKTDEKPYPVYSSQTKDKGLMGYYKDYLYEDAITWTTDGANAGTVNYRAGKFYCTNVCGVLLSNEVKANQMIAEALNSVAKGYVSYVGNPKLMNNVMADIVIQIPTQAEEREQLSSIFANLDNLITLHQRKGKAAVSGCSNDANNSKGVCCKARDFGYKCHKKDEPNRFDA